MIYRLFALICSSVIIFLHTFQGNAQTAFDTMMWEYPVYVSDSDCRFPGSAAAPENSQSGVSIIVWQEIVSSSTADNRGSIYLSAAVLSDDEGDKVLQKKRFAGPFPYSGEVPVIHSEAVSTSGIIGVTAAGAPGELSVYISSDGGNVFTGVSIDAGGRQLIAPKIFALSGGGFLLFATQTINESFSLVYARSRDGYDWTSFEPFAPAQNVRNAFLPALSPFNDGDIVLFQAQHESGRRLSYQLFSTLSKDGGTSWTQPVMITDVPTGTDQPFTSYHNQRPFVSGSTAAWERTFYSSENAQIVAAQLDENGKISGRITAVSPGNGNAGYPILFTRDGVLSMLWFDTGTGREAVYSAENSGLLWSDPVDISSVKGNPDIDGPRPDRNSMFGHPLVSKKTGVMHYFWQQKMTDSTSRIVRLSPDTSVKRPSVAAESFSENKRYASERMTASVAYPRDSSGIAGYTYSWSQNFDEEPPKDSAKLSDRKTVTEFASQDGRWYLRVRVMDNAGNWSDFSQITYFRDTTPPEKPVIVQPPIDENGLLLSNTFDVQWLPPPDEDTAGYTYILEYHGQVPEVPAAQDEVPAAQTDIPAAQDEVPAAMVPIFPMPAKKALPPARILVKDPSTIKREFYNKRNGLYTFSVSAVDTSGNISEPSAVVLALDKYRAYTAVTSAQKKVDDFGTVSLTISGNDFQYEGTISTVYIDRDGKEPYDRILSAQQNEFTVASSWRITGIQLSDLEEGSYRAAVLHTKRGIAWSPPSIFSVESYGTVKKGRFVHIFTPRWKEAHETHTYTINAPFILLWIVLLLTAVILFMSVRGLLVTAREAAAIRQEIYALITGEAMPGEKKRRAEELQNKGMSLRYKLILFTSTLVVTVILLVSVPLGYLMTTTQEETLAGGLQDRVSVLLESLFANIRSLNPSEYSYELGILPQQSEALEEAGFATIIGRPLKAENDSTNIDFLWATNDPKINEKIDSERINFGQSRMIGGGSLPKEIIEEITARCSALNEDASAASERITREIRELTEERKTATERRREEIDTRTGALREERNTKLAAISREKTASIPPYTATALSKDTTSYLFYKPVLYPRVNDANFVHSIILVEVSTGRLIAAVQQNRQNIVYASTLIAAVALLIGIGMSLVLASVIIKPIRRLAAHVAFIRDTADKEELEGKEIELSSRDEIGLLGETINEMTHGLVKAAAAAKDLTVGKEVQKMFIPLETDSSGKKLTTGKTEDEHVHFFGYYEGAKGVSGDYFDYLKLDDRHYAVIKCDVSGKGVPAALIMVEVATLFLNYFKDWTFKKHGTNLSSIVSQINDLIESRGFKGRFAAFTLCLLDAVTGELWFCNAGDNLIHIYDSSEHKKKTIVLPEAAAAGVFPSFMVDMKGGFKVQKLSLDKNDVLFLYTDGIEEAKRMFRDENFMPMVCAEPGLEKEAPHGFHSVGQDNEEMAPDRVNAVIEAVFAKKSFVLEKYHNPIPNELLEFDFSTCSGTEEDAIMALVSVEKIFRMYKDPSAGEFDTVQVDRKIDEFLRKHFKQYNDYCGRRKDDKQFPEYLMYTHVRQDDQYDDLTLLAIRKC